MESLPVYTDILYTDIQGLAALRANGPGSADSKLEEAARQFSAIFTNMMLKSMRQASVGEGIFDSQQSDFYRDMFDQQISLQLTQRGGLGFTELLVEQLKPMTQNQSRSQVQAYEDVSQLPVENQIQDRASAAVNLTLTDSRTSAVQ